MSQKKLELLARGGNELEKYIYITVFILFIPMFFIILKAMELEKKFKQGHIFEIRLAYVLFCLILASLATGAVKLIFSLF